jgi:hypothetical protein
MDKTEIPRQWALLEVPLYICTLPPSPPLAIKRRFLILGINSDSVFVMGKWCVYWVRKYMFKYHLDCWRASTFLCLLNRRLEIRWVRKFVRPAITTKVFLDFLCLSVNSNVFSSRIPLALNTIKLSSKSKFHGLVWSHDFEEFKVIFMPISTAVWPKNCGNVMRFLTERVSLASPTSFRSTHSSTGLFYVSLFIKVLLET